VEIPEYIEVGDRVVVLGRTRGHVRSNATRFDIRIAHVWEVRDGFAVRFEPYIETAQIVYALEAA
jgi:ketosteroid isomerase-like protein